MTRSTAVTVPFSILTLDRLPYTLAHSAGDRTCLALACTVAPITMLGSGAIGAGGAGRVPSDQRGKKEGNESTDPVTRHRSTRQAWRGGVLARYSGGGAGVSGRRRLRDRCPAKCRGCMCPPDVPRRAPAVRSTQEANRGRHSGGEPRQLARTRWDAEDSGCLERPETPTLSGMLSRTEVRTVDHKPSQG